MTLLAARETFAIGSPPIVWIVDASPFIVLAKVGRLDLLAAPGLLAETVIGEIEAGPESDPARQALTPGSVWAQQVERAADVPVPAAVSAWNLDAGEEACLALALSLSASVLVILDDSDGRRAAQALRLEFTGTVGVVLQARQTGRIPALAPILRALRDVGAFLPSDARLRSLLTTVGETWP